VTEPYYDLNVEPIEKEGATAGAWLYCFFYCAFAFGMFYFAVKVWRDFVPILITGFFAAWGVVYIVLTIRQTISQGKFGTVNLLLQRPPPSIGGRLAATISVPGAAMSAPTLVAQITCYKETFGGGDKGGSMTEPVWGAKKSFPLRRKPGGGSAAIAIVRRTCPV